MNDTLIVGSFVVSYVAAGLLLFGVSLGGIVPQKRWAPVRLRRK